jgi:hypothetical protein
MKLGWQPRKWLAKKAKAGNRGFPLGTVAFYGPDDRRASKVAVGIMMGTDDDPVVMRRWFSQDGDVRRRGHRRRDGIVPARPWGALGRDDVTAGPA